MKANEFIKKHGWDEAKELIAKHEECYLPDVFDMWSDKLQDFVLCTKYASFNISDLKCLVESHELIESCGGLQSVGEKLTHGMYESRAVIDRLKQAILDVESCQ